MTNERLEELIKRLEELKDAWNITDNQGFCDGAYMAFTEAIDEVKKMQTHQEPCERCNTVLKVQRLVIGYQAKYCPSCGIKLAESTEEAKKWIESQVTFISGMYDKTPTQKEIREVVEHIIRLEVK